MIDKKIEIEKLEALNGRYHLVFPSYITHIRFPRYKNMTAGARIDFDFPVTALVGANGSGKTSVLNALYGAPMRKSTGDFWFSTEVDPIEEGEGSPNRFIYGHYHRSAKKIVETRKARVRKFRNGRDDPNYWEPTKEAPGDEMEVPTIPENKKYDGRSGDRWNPVVRHVLYINFRKELSAFDKYFYFGKDPALIPHKATEVDTDAGRKAATRRILNKKDQVRYDAALLARVIKSGNTSQLYRKKKIATENRLLTKEQLGLVSYILGREYVEARWIKHRLFKGDGGISVVFKTKHGRYSEAFAGSGEVAVTSCVVQVTNEAKKGTLLLLDEPEVSLHPGAQERLLAFLVQFSLRKHMQVVFSTHSPHLISTLPDRAIKTFYQLPDGAFSVIPSTHPYAAFRRLGSNHGNEILIVVEDRLAKNVIDLAIPLIEDEAARKLFRVEIAPGGATTILNNRIPVFMEGDAHIFVLLDGDQCKCPAITDPDTIPTSNDGTLEKTIFDEIGAKPLFLIDGGVNGGNKAQKFAAQRKYISWARKNLAYIPTSCPEELILKASSSLPPGIENNALECKKALQAAATKMQGKDATSEDTDNFGKFTLALHKETSQDLIALKNQLLNWLKSI